ncbi:ectoine synthase [Thiomicrospira aerophila AL3]|uniref:L-ectoine synthase n=1 Tax=Thiomicrospira aerophila AL3 TaxID=717772 RepID=W0DWT6_9GAMM|nr:ectoine synthase [Thiomicrospira aerophila]AHF01454.1 ectoine synthase [Thiomicrospira aerophila AL3]
MIFRRLNEVIGTERDVKADNGNWVSRRLLLAKDGMGFSMHDTTIFAGTKTYIHYANHLEAVYCVAGKGEIEDLETGVTTQLEDGVLYALNGHERHYLSASEDMRMICVFNPPITGREVHDENGVYPLLQA